MHRLSLNLAVSLAAIAFSAALAQTPADPLPPGPAKDTLERVCSACHDPSIVLTKQLDYRGWDDVVQTMAGRGTGANEAELKRITQYLADNLGPPNTAQRPLPALHQPAPRRAN